MWTDSDPFPPSSGRILPFVEPQKTPRPETSDLALADQDFFDVLTGRSDLQR